MKIVKQMKKNIAFMPGYFAGHFGICPTKKNLNIMKKTLIAAFVALTFFACQRQTTFTITGTVANTEYAEGRYVHLHKTVDGVRILADSAQIINGVYVFTGSVDEPASALLSLFDDERRRFIINANIIVENANIEVTSDAEGRTRISGSPNNNRLQEFTDTQSVVHGRVTVLLQERRNAREIGDTVLDRTLTEKINEVNAELQELQVGFIRSNINNAAGRSHLERSAILLQLLSPDELEDLISEANRHTLQIPEVIAVVERIDAVRRTAVGQPFVDLRMPDRHGNYIAISDFVGNGYLMIDFTGTWCAPCRAGKPAMIETFNRFNDRGFNIIGVWFEHSHEAWVEGMDALNMPDWPQMSDLRGMQSEARTLYQITGVPHSVLIDPNGIIIARSLRGDDLNNKLEKLLGR